MVPGELNQGSTSFRRWNASWAPWFSSHTVRVWHCHVMRMGLGWASPHRHSLLPPFPVSWWRLHSLWLTLESLTLSHLVPAIKQDTSPPRREAAVMVCKVMGAMVSFACSAITRVLWNRSSVAWKRETMEKNLIKHIFFYWLLSMCALQKTGHNIQFLNVFIKHLLSSKTRLLCLPLYY